MATMFCKKWKHCGKSCMLLNICGLFKKYLDWNCGGCSLGGMCL
jgi:hypothetical protein